MVGNVLGNRYEVLERIGTGGMSLVYRARDMTLNRLVAVKILKHQWAEDPEVVRRFEQEARAAASLVDRHIVQVYDVGRDEPDIHYMVMELVAGETLRAKIDREAPLPVKTALEIADQVAQGLEVAHARRLVHRDIKPQNVLLSATGDVKVTDFGIAYAATTGTLVNTGSLLGTVQYLSPEQARGKFIGPQSDIYSLGVVLFEMLTGRLPFEGDTPIGVAIKHLQDEPPRIDKLRPEVPAQVADIVERALSKDPAERYQSAHAMRLDIERVLHPEPVLEKPQPMVSPSDEADEVPHRGRLAQSMRTNKPRRQWPWVVALSVTVLLLLGAGAYAFHRWLNPPIVTVPNVIGKPVAEARLALKTRGLVVFVAGRASSQHIARNRVVKEDPAPGARVKSGETVSLVLSSGPTTLALPGVIQESYYLAKQSLEALGLHVRMRATASGQPGGTVVQQQPRPGEVVAEGSLVTLWVSNGASASQMVMPNLIGLTMSQAARLLAHAHVTMASPSSEYSTEPPDTIIDQSPAPYASLQGVTTVSVTLSHGPSPVSASLPINHSTVRWKIPASAAPKSLFKVVVTDPAGNEEIFYQQVNPGQRVTYRVVWYGTQGQMVVSLNGRLIPTPPLKSMVSASPSPSPSSSPSPSGSPSPSPSASSPAPSSNQSG